MTNDVIAQRMNAMETIAYDSTLPDASDVKRLVDMARAERYDVRVLDLYGLPLQRAIAQNQNRREHQRVPENVLRATYEAYQPLDDPAVIKIDRFDLKAAEIKKFLYHDHLNISAYREVVFIGDFQGSAVGLRDPRSPLADKLKDDVYYVYLGDYLDRGVENAEVLQWLMKNAVGKPNVLMLRGNHEKHIELFVDGKNPVSNEFEQRTLPQILKAGITADDLRPLVDGLVEVADLTWKNWRILATHGGLSSIPAELHLVPGEQFESGVGSYDQPVDQLFEEWAIEDEKRHEVNVLQVHGHRNTRMIPTLAYPHSANLEGQVEFGGQMRMLRLGQAGLEPINIRNTVYRSHADRVAETLAKGHKMHGPTIPVPAWHARGEAGQTQISEESLASLRRHAMINERVSAVMSHVSAFNFSRAAFDGDEWDRESLNARGLFLDTQDGNIVARGYEKFFNVNEKADTKMEALQQTLKFPVVGYRKENGFLGITGYDQRTDTLVIASKSMLDSEFAGWFREILEKELGEAGLERLYRINRDLDASCVFEVIDVKRDPHMIKYERDGVVLLDVIRRAEKFEALPYKDLEQVGKLLGCPVKERSFNLDNPIAFERIVKRIEDRNFAIKGERTEGFVFEDQDGTMVKTKSGYYAFWKRMRGAKDYIIKAREAGKTYSAERYKDDPEAVAFVEFAMRQPTEALMKDIITLREAYEQDPNCILPGSLTAEDMIQRKADEDRAKALEGFSRGAAAVERQIQAGTAKEETIQKIIDAAREDGGRMDVLSGMLGFSQKIKENMAGRAR